MKNFPGSKNNSGFLQLLANVTPGAHTFVDAFSGSGAVAYFFSYRSLFERVIAVDSNPDFVNVVKDHGNFQLATAYEIGCGLRKAQQIASTADPFSVVFYFDPPYMFTTRRSNKRLYHQEWSYIDHLEFIDIVRELARSQYVIVSHYPCDFYDIRLGSFNRFLLNVMTRKGVAIEALYTSFDPQQVKLATYDFLGVDKIDRQRRKRQITNMVSKVSAMSLHDRERYFQALKKRFSL